MPEIGINVKTHGTATAEAEFNVMAQKIAAAVQKQYQLSQQEAKALTQIIAKKKNLAITENELVKAKKMAAAATKKNIVLSEAENLLINKKVSLFDRVNKKVFRYRMALISVMVASYALQRIITAAWNFTYVGAQINEQVAALDRLSIKYGTTADSLIADMRLVSKETLSNAEIAKSAGKAMVMGIAAETTVKLMKIATAASRVMGKTASEMFADITLGTARMSKKILDNIGIIVDWRSAYSKHAAQLGITTNMLDEQQKMVARTNAIIKAGGLIIDTVSDKVLTQRQKLDKLVSSWKNWFDGLKQGFVDIIIPLEGMEKIRKRITMLQDKIEDLQKIQRLGLFPDLSKTINNLKKTVSGLQKVVDADDTRIKQQTELAEITKRMSTNLNELQKVQTTLVKESRIDELTRQYKALADGLKKALELSVQFSGDISGEVLRNWTETRDKSRIILGEIARETLLLIDVETKKILAKQKENSDKALRAEQLHQKQILSSKIKHLKEVKSLWTKHYKELKKEYLEQAEEYLDMETAKKDFLATILGFRKKTEEKGLSDTKRFALEKTKVEEAVLAATNASEENRVELFKRATQAQMDFIGKWQGIRQEGFDAQPFINVEKEMAELTRLSDAYKFWAEDAIGEQKRLAEETAEQFNEADAMIIQVKEDLRLVSIEYQDLVKLMQDEKLKTTLDKTQVDAALDAMLEKFRNIKTELEKPIKVSVSTTGITGGGVGATKIKGSLHSGIPFVPETGIYELQRGERVTSTAQNTYNQQQDNRQFVAKYYDSGRGNSVEKEFETRQMFIDMQRYNASLTV